VGFFDWLLGRKRERPGEAEVTPRDEQSREAEARRLEEERKKREAEARRREEEEKRKREAEERQRQAEAQKRRDIAECRVESFTNSIGMTLKRIPAGSSVMGSYKHGSEQPLHKVTISRTFYMGIHPVTQGEWLRVMGDYPSCFTTPPRQMLPVESVSWPMAQDFCRKLSEKEGLPYRLPSEAEWEYACRADTTREYCFVGFSDYSDEDLGEYAWFRGNTDGGTRHVGQKKPNAWGLFDMHGNVWEWCEDVWHNSYQGAPGDGSAWVEGGDAQSRVMRGGSSQNTPDYLRSAYRYQGYADTRCHSAYGFRVVLAPGPR